VHHSPPGAQLRDVAASPGITGRSAYGIVTDLAEAGYVAEQKPGAAEAAAEAAADPGDRPAVRPCRQSQPRPRPSNPGPGLW
jgi:hypothetical protein